MTRRSAITAALLGCMASTCIPALGPDDSLVTSPRILAIRADPAEARPGTPVTFTALVARANAAAGAAPIGWSFCLAPKPLTEDNVVSNACLGSSSLMVAGVGPVLTAKTPPNGCSLFGPDPASASTRPRDPDSTGGYYQPLRADLEGSDSAFALARIRCDLANADAAAASTFAMSYELNQNPQLLPLTASVNGAALALASIPPGARIALEASWPAASAETYAYFDLASGTVTSQRESMQVAWYVSAGHLDTESTGRAADDDGVTTDNGWTAPAAPGTVHLWIVLRDSRGGVDFAEYDLVVPE